MNNMSIAPIDFIPKLPDTGFETSLKSNPVPCLYTKEMEEWIIKNAYWIDFQGDENKKQRIKSKIYELATATKIGKKVFFDAKKSYDQQVSERGCQVQKLSINFLNDAEKSYDGSYDLTFNILDFKENNMLILAHELRHYEQQHRPDFYYVAGDELDYMIFQKRMETETYIQDLFFLEETKQTYHPMQDLLRAYKEKAEKIFSGIDENTEEKISVDSNKVYRYIVTNLERYLLDTAYQIDDDLLLTDEQKEQIESQRNEWGERYNDQIISNFGYATSQLRTTPEQNKICIDSIGNHMESDLSYNDLKKIFMRDSFTYEDENCVNHNYIIANQLIQFEQTKRDGIINNARLFMHKRPIDYETLLQCYSSAFSLMLSEIRGEEDKLYSCDTLLNNVVKYNDLKTLEKCIANGLDTEKINNVLCYSVESGRIDCVKMLLNNGADANAEIDERTPLDCLYTDRNKYMLNEVRYEIAENLLEHGADINHINKQGYTLLGEASNHGDAQLVRLALENNADLNVKYADNFYKTPLFAAIKEDDFELARASVQIGYPILEQHIHSTFEYGCNDKLFLFLFQEYQKNPLNKDLSNVVIENLINISNKIEDEKRVLPMLNAVIQCGGNVNTFLNNDFDYTMLDVASAINTNERLLARCLYEKGARKKYELVELKDKIQNKQDKLLRNEYYHDMWQKYCGTDNTSPSFKKLDEFTVQNPHLITDEKGNLSQDYLNWKMEKGYDDDKKIGFSCLYNKAIQAVLKDETMKIQLKKRYKFGRN